MYIDFHLSWHALRVLCTSFNFSRHREILRVTSSDCNRNSMSLWPGSLKTWNKYCILFSQKRHKTPYITIENGKELVEETMDMKTTANDGEMWLIWYWNWISFLSYRAQMVVFSSFADDMADKIYFSRGDNNNLIWLSALGKFMSHD